MKYLLSMMSLLLLGNMLRAQYVYTINADSVKITNHCDTAELILENHTQTVPGFLFNKGRGRTEFRRGLQKINDTLYLVGADSLSLHPGVNLPATRIAFGSSANTITGSSVFTYDSVNRILTLGAAHLSTGSNNLLFSYNLPVGATGQGNVAVGMHGLFAPLTTGGQNVAIGDYTMTGITSGSGNAAVGPGALQRLTTGDRNVAYGYQALQWLTTQSFNTAIGPGTFNNAIVGTGNVNIGGDPGIYFSIPDTIGNNNVFIGYKANDLNSTGNSNIVIGDSSYTSETNNSTLIGTGMNTTISNIVGIGRTDQDVIIGSTSLAVDNGAKLQVNGNQTVGSAIDQVQLKINTPTAQTAAHAIFQVLSPSGVGVMEVRGNDDGTQYTGFGLNLTNGSQYIGKNSGANAQYNTAASYGVGNVSLGPNTLASVTTGHYNTALGADNLRSLTTGNWNTGFGENTFSALVSGSDNLCVGQEGMIALTTGSANTGIGNNVLKVLATGNNNVAIGNDAGAAATGNGSVYIGYQAGRFDINPNRLYIANSSTSTPLVYGQFDSSILKLNASVFIGASTSPTAALQLRAGTASVGTAPLKLTAGTVLTTPEDGAIEYDGTDLYLTQSTVRYKLSKTLTGQLTTSFGGASVTAGNTITASISVPGAQPGDVVAVSANSGAVNPPSIIITAYVTTAGSVTLQAYNSSGSTVTLASDTYKVRVIR